MFPHAKCSRAKRSSAPVAPSAGLGALLTLALSLAPPASAATYRWVFDQQEFLVQPGATVPVAVYLEESVAPTLPGTPGETALLDDAGGLGLGSISLGLLWSDAPPSDPAIVPDTNAIVPGPDLFALERSVSSDGASLLAVSFDPVHGTEDPPGSGVFRVLVGTFEFTAGDLPGQQTTILATDGGADDETLDFPATPGVALDPIIDQATTAITVVPEPGSLSMALGILIAAAATRRFGAAGRRG